MTCGDGSSPGCRHWQPRGVPALPAGPRLGHAASGPDCGTPRHAPQLLTVVGIGPDTAVTLLSTVEDNPERLASEASFAALCGVSPVERSSGSRQYRRLNRGGDPGRPTPPCTGSCRPDCASTRAPRTTTNGALKRGKDPKQGRPMPQTLHCPRGLPPGQAPTVTNPAIGAAVRCGSVSG